MELALLPVHADLGAQFSQPFLGDLLRGLERVDRVLKPRERVELVVDPQVSRLEVRLDEGLVHGVHRLRYLLNDLSGLLPAPADVTKHSLDQVEVNSASDRDSEIHPIPEPRSQGIDALDQNDSALRGVHGPVPGPRARLEIVDRGLHALSAAEALDVPQQQLVVGQPRVVKVPVHQAARVVVHIHRKHRATRNQGLNLAAEHGLSSTTRSSKPHNDWPVGVRLLHQQLQCPDEEEEPFVETQLVLDRLNRHP
mmetsp:Transcript_12779/g.35760  ORF Transcript_12779/g.35760 Transcript_12779/m.35760 type:complete len:253 (+) Transcript_12779:1593-2351(+)